MFIAIPSSLCAQNLNLPTSSAIQPCYFYLKILFHFCVTVCASVLKIFLYAKKKIVHRCAKKFYMIKKRKIVLECAKKFYMIKKREIVLECTKKFYVIKKKKNRVKVC